MPDERAVASACQKSCIDERIQDRVTRAFVESPEPARLLLGQAQPRHLEILSAYTSHHVLHSTARFPHRSPTDRPDLLLYPYSQPVPNECDAKVPQTVASMSREGRAASISSNL